MYGSGGDEESDNVIGSEGDAAGRVVVVAADAATGNGDVAREAARDAARDTGVDVEGSATASKTTSSAAGSTLDVVESRIVKSRLDQ